MVRATIRFVFLALLYRGVYSDHCSTFEGQGDDGLNIPTIFLDIESVSPDRKSLTLGKDGAVESPGSILWAGSTMNLFSRTTLLPLGTATVSAIQGNTVVLAAALPAGVGQWDLVNNAASYADYVEVRSGAEWERTRKRPAPAWPSAGVGLHLQRQPRSRGTPQVLQRPRYAERVRSHDWAGDQDRNRWCGQGRPTISS